MSGIVCGKLRILATSAPEFPRSGGGCSCCNRVKRNRGRLPFGSYHRPLRLLLLKLTIPPHASAAEYSEQLLDNETAERKRNKIAGIDQDVLLDPSALADPDSCFCEFKGVRIHHKVCDPQSLPDDSMLSSTLPRETWSVNIGLPMILLHGFGASVFSWHQVMKPLACLSGSKVLAFDRPAFGLTSRPSFCHDNDKKPLNPYSMEFSVLATLYFVDFLAAGKAILIGHSAGSLVAVNAYFEAPERIAALILVAPAILAPNVVHKAVEGRQQERDSQIVGNESNSNILGKLLINLCEVLSKFTRYVAQVIMQMMKAMADMLNSLCNKALSAILRSAFAVTLVRMIIDKFGIAAIRNAWYDSKRVTEDVLHGYTKPLRTKGWDKALVEFTAAMLIGTDFKPKPLLAKKLHEISCPVLVVTGDSDRLVPSWNSEKLSRAIPGSCLEVIKNCGHLPHEEKREEFLAVIGKFLQRAFGDSRQPCVEAVS